MSYSLGQLRKLVLAQGFTWTVSKKNSHVIVKSPTGRQIAVLSSSPSRGRSIDHSISNLRAGGVNIPRKTDR